MTIKKGKPFLNFFFNLCSLFTFLRAFCWIKTFLRLNSFPWDDLVSADRLIYVLLSLNLSSFDPGDLDPPLAWVVGKARLDSFIKIKNFGQCFPKKVLALTNWSNLFGVYVFLLAMNRCSIARDQTSSKSENRNMLLTLVIPALLPRGSFVHFSKKCECT